METKVSTEFCLCSSLISIYKLTAAKQQKACIYVLTKISSVCSCIFKKKVGGKILMSVG